MLVHIFESNLGANPIWLSPDEIQEIYMKYKCSLIFLFTEPKIREHLYFILWSFFFFYIKYSRYGVHVNIGYDVHLQQPMPDTCGAKLTVDDSVYLCSRNLLPVLFTCNTNFLEKYMSSLIFCSAYNWRCCIGLGLCSSAKSQA